MPASWISLFPWRAPWLTTNFLNGATFLSGQLTGTERSMESFDSVTVSCCAFR